MAKIFIEWNQETIGSLSVLELMKFKEHLKLLIVRTDIEISNRVSSEEEIEEILK